MTTHRPIPIDDHGDQFPGAVPPARPSAPRPGAGDTFPLMYAEYVRKVNSVVAADRDDLALELAAQFAAESVAAGQTGRR